MPAKPKSTTGGPIEADRELVRQADSGHPGTPMALAPVA
jgi:hypothetical protein